jgi:hypothetical protein
MRKQLADDQPVKRTNVPGVAKLEGSGTLLRIAPEAA